MPDATDDGPIHEEPEQPGDASVADLPGAGIGHNRPKRLTFEEIAVKYNLPDDEIMRRRILARLKQRITGLVKRGSEMSFQYRHSITAPDGDPRAEDIRDYNEFRAYAASGIQRCRHKHRAKSRCAHLAYGFFKRKPYLAIENSCKVPPDWGRVKRMILDQDSAAEGVVLQQLAEWMSHVPVSARRSRSQVH